MVRLTMASRLSKDVVGSDAAQEHAAWEPLERHAVIVADAQLPDVGCTFHLFDLERRMPGIGDEALQRLSGALLDLDREVLEVFFEPLGAEELHQTLRSLMSSLMLLNAFTRPLRISSSASRSPACHSLVQK